MTPPTNLNLNTFYLQCSCHGAQCLQYQHRKLNKSKLWPLQCLVNSSPLMSSKRFFSQYFVAPAKYGQVSHIRLEFVGNFFLNNCHWVSKAAVFLLRNLLILESCSLHIFWTWRLCPWEAFCCTSRHCCLTPLPRPIFYADQQSTCLKSWHFGSCRMLHFAKRPLSTAEGICSCVQQRGSWISSWCWNDGGAVQTSVAVARNTCLCVVEGWSVNEHLSFCVKLFLRVLVFFSFGLSYFHTCPGCSVTTRDVQK